MQGTQSIVTASLRLYPVCKLLQCNFETLHNHSHQPNVLTAVRVDEPVASEVASNSTSWTSGLEDIVTNRPKSHTVPADLPLLQFDLSSGDERTASTTSGRTQSTNATPIAAPG